MRILQVIHGYPPTYNAGSEVYTQTLSRALAKRHEVHVFTREEDSFAADYAFRQAHDGQVASHIVNVPRSRDRYRHRGVDRRFAEVLDRVRPNMVHVGHLNHLSTSLLDEAFQREVPVVFTLHDFWLTCPRGQFMQMHPDDSGDLWPVCGGQDDAKWATRCYARYFSGADDEQAEDVDYWTGWAGRRMAHVRPLVERVDRFISPSDQLAERMTHELGIPSAKIIRLDYGFDLQRLSGRHRASGEPFTFGYIGTHLPAKGIHHLIDAFGELSGDVRLRIWGRPRGQDTESCRGRGHRFNG